VHGEGCVQDAVPLPVCVAAAEHLSRPGSCEGIMAKPSEYRQMSDEQIHLALNEVVKNLFHLRFQSATDRLETPSEILKAKREVARIKTVVRERQLKKVSAPAAAVTAEKGA